MKLDLAHGSQLDPAHLEEGGHGGDQHAQVGHGQAEQVDIHHTLWKRLDINIMMTLYDGNN